MIDRVARHDMFVHVDFLGMVYLAKYMYGTY